MNNFSKIGFILSTLGSSIGLGHIWRFPYVAAESGGSAFVLMYIVLTIFIGVPIMVAKMVIGNKTQKSTVQAFKELDSSKKKGWRFSGLMIITGPVILTFYTVILGWVLYYIVMLGFDLPKDLQASKAIFTTLISNDLLGSSVAFIACMLMTSHIVSRGISSGLERLNVILMPLLFIIFVGLLIYALTLDSFNEAFNYLFAFKLSSINANVLMGALGQVFFSLSIGFGTLITYAAVTAKGTNLLSSSLLVAISGIVISIVAGLIIFTFTFNYGPLEEKSGPGLLFISLPLVFGAMKGGTILFILFFLAVFFAGITSAISLLEPLIAYLIDTYGMDRKRASYISMLPIALVGFIVNLSLHQKYGAAFSFAGKDLFSWVDYVSASIMMPLGALSAIIFIAFMVDKSKVKRFTKKFMSDGIFNLWYFIIKYISPLVILLIFAVKIFE